MSRVICLCDDNRNSFLEPLVVSSYLHCFGSVLSPVTGWVVDEERAALSEGALVVLSPTRVDFSSVLALFGRLFSAAALLPTGCLQPAFNDANTRPSGQRPGQILPRRNTVTLLRGSPAPQDEQELDGLPEVDVLSSWKRCVLGRVRQTCNWSRWKIHEVVAFWFHCCRQSSTTTIRR